MENSARIFRIRLNRKRISDLFLVLVRTLHPTRNTLTVISIVLPTARAWADLTLWTLRSYDTQTNKSFEIILVEDGPPSREIVDLSIRKWTFPIRYFNSPRTADPNLAHKNHARNVGIKNARFDIVFPCDCDFMVMPNFVERVLALYALALAQGQKFCLYPPCAILKNSPHDINDMDWGSHEFDAFLTDYRSHPDRDAALRPIQAHPEGMHLMDRRLFELLGFYDEQFLGWGANKMELQRRLNETGIKQALLEGCMLFHQPHPDLHSGDNHKRPEIKRHNIELMEDLGRKRLNDEAWKKRKTMIQLPAQTKIPQGSLVLDWFIDRLPPQTLSENPLSQRIERTIIKNSDPTAPIVLFGPWIGEFGWEIARWQGAVRRIAEDHDGYTLVVCGDPGHSSLYPYAHEYWSLPRGLYEQLLTRESERLIPEDAAARAMAAVYGVLAEEVLQKGCDLAHVPASHKNTRIFSSSPESQRFVKIEADRADAEFAEFIRPSSDYVCLFPRRRDLNKQKNWPIENWEKLIDWLHEDRGLGSVILGRAEDTWNIDVSGRPHAISTISLQQDRRLGINIALLNQSVASIGSECGGPFLALLCGCPSYVMGGTEWKQRYEVDENPLGTECLYVESSGYAHSFESTVQGVGEWLSRESLHDRRPVAPKPSFLSDEIHPDWSIQVTTTATPQPDRLSILERIERLEREVGM